MSSVEEEGPVHPEKTLPTIGQAIDHIQELRLYIEGLQYVSITILQSLNKVEEFFMTQRLNAKK